MVAIRDRNKESLNKGKMKWYFSTKYLSINFFKNYSDALSITINSLNFADIKFCGFVTKNIFVRTVIFQKGKM
jgi:hypothetical protein